MHTFETEVARGKFGAQVMPCVGVLTKTFKCRSERLFGATVLAFAALEHRTAQPALVNLR